MFGIVIYAAPVFFLGFLVQLVFADLLGWLPDLRAGPARSPTSTLDKITHLYLIDTLHRRRPRTRSGTASST